MFISVTLLYDNGKRRSAYEIKTQVPIWGWLHYEVARYGPYNYDKVEARLLNDKGVALLVLDKARLVSSRGQQGALMEGVEYRKKGSKHSISDKQQWWCEAPPRSKPLLDHQARLLAAEREWQRMNEAWGYD